MNILKTSEAFAVAASVCVGCDGAHDGASTSADQSQCRNPVAVATKPPVAPLLDVPSGGDDAESRVRKVAEPDLRCSAQQVYVRRVYSVGDIAEGGDFEFYGAERCGLYQMYRVSRKHGVVEPEGVDVFLVSPVSPGTLRITSPPSYRARAPSRGEALLLIGKRGVVCQASVGNEVSNNVWAVEGCSSESPMSLGVVAVRASEATKGARLELQWFTEPPRASRTERISPSMWRPFTVVDLTGERQRHVSIFCRGEANSEYECERFMVYGGDVGWFVPVARARWIPVHHNIAR